ncbi:snaclec echicetin subunit alpha-like [Entelurus aequoreus]|uniref:snaclec echicetin subunit alpha-like n=1 Tax=Entelurus aequoreus TaxID=161455 RepID=UPI002B1DB546|nr:snaclec echicetin subunit alpha-like [Entelurus aequoreus]XP_061910530.1 snaclec echicetin subunit alpha-like [Entelurus aequoreus]XP_061910531.1 snaclec echicetin subunit alpha-like [Entelurus aequoreus]
MQFTLFLLCGISGLIAGTWAAPAEKKKKDCCPPGWTQVEGHCYILQEDPRIFSDAERVCNALGGNLASITDAVKNAAVTQLVRNGGFRPAWIGLTDAVTEQVFVWTDGSPFDFRSFFSSFFFGDCVFITSSGRWVTSRCFFRFPFVCGQEACCDPH